MSEGTDTQTAPRPEVSAHAVEPDAGFCLVCRARILRAGLWEWRHDAV